MNKTIQSACDALMKKTYRDVWMRGMEYAKEGHVEILSKDDRYIEAAVKGTQTYRVNLRLPGKGISNKCTCPYVE